MLPRLKILKIAGENASQDRRDFYSVMLFICLAVPTVILQHYITTSTGELTKLHSLKEINNHKPTKYYQPGNYYVHVTNYIYSTKFEAYPRSNAGRHGFNMYLYFVVPIYESPADTLSYNNLVGWLGYRFKENTDYSEDRKAEYTDFFFNSIHELKAIDLNNFYYLEKIGKSEDDDGFQAALKTLPFYDELNTTTVFKRKHTPYEQRNGNKLRWLSITLMAGMVLCLLLICIPKINKKELKAIQAGKPFPGKTDFFSSLKLHKVWPATQVLIYINVLIFLLMFFAGCGFLVIQPKPLLAWGGCYAPPVKDGQWWRLLTSTFLHSGIVHILYNMLALWLAGMALEKKTGTRTFIVSYLITGVCASIVSVMWHDQAPVVGVGASGAIFGLFGVSLTLIFAKRYAPSSAKALLIMILICAGSSLFMGLIGNVDNSAHIGGLLSGMLIGLFIFPSIPKEKDSPSLVLK
ncbi:MAG: rhomboid family intramembrane serine protease [Dysgonamonadaceae bacterium]|nr:rhomboid family intramembrane serine protease [Dysgonamonadaceae bacterium]